MVKVVRVMGEKKLVAESLLGKSKCEKKRKKLSWKCKFKIGFGFKCES